MLKHICTYIGATLKIMKRREFMKKFRLLIITILIVVISCTSILVGCDFNNNKGGESNSSNGENNLAESNF